MADILEDEGTSVEDVTGDSVPDDQESSSADDCPTIIVEECTDDTDTPSPADESDSSDEAPPPPRQSAIEELKRLCDSSSISDRQIAGSKISFALVEIADNEPDIYTVFSLICKLSDDEEGMVRAELVENIPALASYCQLYRPKMKFLMRQQLVPITVKLLVDEQKQVRDASRTVLRLLFQKNLIEEVLAKEWICPFVASSARYSSSEERMAEAASLMCDLAPLIDKDYAKECFLETFSSLADQSSCAIRMVCAENFGCFSKAVGQEATESLLLHRFLGLCTDMYTSVRIACAHAFADVASVLSPSVRRQSVPAAFVDLLSDRNNSVKFAAYENLGKLISTFDLSYAEACWRYPVADNCCDVLSDASQVLSGDCQNETTDCKQAEVCIEITRIENGPLPIDSCPEYCDFQRCTNGDEPLLLPSKEKTDILSFNSFQYWRTPLPDLELDMDVLEVMDCGKASEPSSNLQCFSETKSCVRTENVFVNKDHLRRKSRLKSCKKSTVQGGLFGVDDGQGNIASATNSMFPASLSPFDQDIVPSELLEKYVLMTEPGLSYIVEKELAQFCAFTLPAVAQTLRRENWGCLDRVFRHLATSREWEVRKTVAASLHGLAVILGRDIASAELVPFCLHFFNDIDEVRIAFLKNLANFIKKITEMAAATVMAKISDFVNAENDRNWRIRQMLASQLSLILLQKERHEDVMIPIAMFLLQDRVWAVRLEAIKLVSHLLSFLNENEGKIEPILKDLHTDFAESTKWRCRQTYAILCEYMPKVFSVNCPEFVIWYSRNLVSHLLPLALDSVPNVRLCVARCLSTLTGFYLEEMWNHHGDSLRRAINSLQEDQDKDVCYFSSFESDAIARILLPTR